MEIKNGLSNYFSLYTDFTREDWATLRANTPLTLTEADLQVLCSFNEAISIKEVEEIYLPLSRLLNLYFGVKGIDLQDLQDDLGEVFEPGAGFGAD